MRTSKNIDSILQVTNDIINKNDNYRDYIINQNNSLYMRQLPLLVKNERMKALINKKLDDSQKNSSLIIEDGKEKEKFKFKQYLSPLNEIRNIKIKSKKLPPLCPLYNSKGELIPTAIKSSKILFKKVDYSNFLNRNNLELGFPRSGKPVLKKMEIKKLKYNRSCDFNIQIKLDDLENYYFKTPEYEYLTYDEKEIFGKDSINNYEEIIKNKIIELQTVHNKNDTIKKQKIYKYGFDKRKIILTLDSLKVKIYELKKENAPILEKKSDTPYFEYTLPLALLPLFYFKGVESFLILLTKIIIFKETNFKFELEEKFNEILSKTLKNCNDFDVNNSDNYGEGECTSNEKEIFINDTDINNNETRSVTKQNSFIKKNNINSYVLNSEIKTNQFNNTITVPSNNTNEVNYNNSTTEQNSSNNLYTVNVNNNTNNNNQNTIPVNELRRSTNAFFNKKTYIKSFDIFASKKNANESKIFSRYEYFWITPIKSFILSIETPLITIFAPSNNNLMKQYINFELLFYIYKNNFIMWDFYIMKYLSTFKNFRIFFEQLYSIPKKTNISSFLTFPKIKKILSTNFELVSIITRPLSEKQKRAGKTSSEKNRKYYDNPESPKSNRKYESSKTKNYDKVNFTEATNTNKNIMFINDKSSNSPIKNRHSKQIDSKFSINALNASTKDITNSNSNSNSPTNKQSNNTINNINNLATYNSVFIQKGLIFIVSVINEERDMINEFSIHFNVEQLRKFQVMEVMQNKMNYFLKFMRVNYDTEKVSFDFDSFKEFNELNWIKEVSKYNYEYLSQHKTISEEKFIDENGQDMRLIKVLMGLKNNVKIKVEMKCPLIIIQDLDDLGFKVTERVNIDSKVEKILSNISIYNSLDLTRQLIDILKDNNFCRKIVSTQRTSRKKTTKKKLTGLKDNNKLMMRKQTKRNLSIISDSKED